MELILSILTLCAFGVLGVALFMLVLIVICAIEEILSKRF
ncbi:hypothetical protein XaC1_438 [Xanthomonas phage XaC1]|nr:hypothetical protein XaC1_438 [Xanthomonas phage XaC1]